MNCKNMKDELNCSNIGGGVHNLGVSTQHKFILTRYKLQIHIASSMGRTYFVLTIMPNYE